MRVTDNAQAYGLLVLANMFWAGNFVVGSVLTTRFSPVQLVYMRWIIATIILIPLTYSKLNNYQWWNKIVSHWRQLLIMAFTGIFLYSTLVYLALRFTNPVNASIVNGANPMVLTLLGFLLLKEKVNGQQVLGMGISFLGVIWVVSNGSWELLRSFRLNIGDVLMLVNIFIWGIYSIATKKVTKELSALEATALSGILSIFLMFPPVAVDYSTNSQLQFSLGSVLGILYIAIFSSVLAYLCWNQGIKQIGPGRAGIFMNLIPVFAAILAFIFLDQHLTFDQLIGGTLVAAGVYLTNAKKKTKEVGDNNFVGEG
ncbi:DMT family transporter [Metallumcola ferriviriculae]|uniref:DMT family transporter n=1 Tax=Metallumcola ferriviriculae TaxID=3039180 RepID=A0AAU0UQI0_9FIRM|nr:DMT family transporter [Desulfitibacteraceae bacterium MK1]